MKTKDFAKILSSVGYYIIRESDHTVWSNGSNRVAVPHGRTINRMIARRLLKEIGYTKSVPELNYG